MIVVNHDDRLRRCHGRFRVLFDYQSGSNQKLRANLHKTTGTPDRTRTCYPRLRRPVLYPDELRARSWNIRATSAIGLRTSRQDNFGRGDRIRTYDILVPNQARYRAALHPDLALRESRIIRGSCQHFTNFTLMKVKTQPYPYGCVFISTLQQAGYD